ncbi:hypothetical protein QJQ45_007577 [Haematococcus lacustris]|nr:hypothetical protein QJQ45_007577 [Haematococcus lacustris]
MRVRDDHPDKGPVCGAALADFIQYSQLQNSSQAVKEAEELPYTGRKLTANNDVNPDNHIAVGVDPGLKLLSAATPADTTLDSLQARILALEATWDARWEEYLKPRWRRQRSGLYHAKTGLGLQTGYPQQAGSPSGWYAQPGASGIVIPPPQGPPWGRWLDRDTNGCLNFQCIGESMQRLLKLCSWKDREALPPFGEEYQQGYKLVNDRLPKGRQRLLRAAE